MGGTETPLVLVNKHLSRAPRACQKNAPRRGCPPTLWLLRQIFKHPFGRNAQVPGAQPVCGSQIARRLMRIKDNPTGRAQPGTRVGGDLRMGVMRQGLLVTGAIALGLMFPQRMLANGGMPVLSLFGADWLAIGLAGVVMVEATIIRHMGHVGLWPAPIAMGVANLMSLLAGFPVTFVFSMIVLSTATNPEGAAH